MSGRQIAGYLAKYVTKSVADFGIAVRRFTTAAIDQLDVTHHVRPSPQAPQRLLPPTHSAHPRPRPSRTPHSLTVVLFA
jgi:hypothetical protein